MTSNLTDGEGGDARAWSRKTSAVDISPLVAVIPAQQIAVGVADWLPGYAVQVDDGSFATAVSAIETDARAMAHLISESEALGVNSELPKLLKALADRSIAAGHGGEAYPVLIEEFGRP